MDIKAPSTQLPAVRPSPADLAKRINEKYSEIVTSLRTTFMRAVEIGELLEQAKDRVGHGNFEVWLSSNCQLSFSTARRYMKLAEDRPKIEEQLKLETASGKSVKLTDLNLTSARRLLAAPKSEGSSGQGQGSTKTKPPTTEQYKTIENSLIACLKDLREKAESYAAGTVEALNDTVSDIKSVIEQARRVP
jgi:hypothetical protein